MNKNDFKQNFLNKIKKENIKPIPKIVWIFQEVIKWLLVLIFIFIAGHSLGVIFYILLDFNFYLLPLYLQSSEKTLIVFGLILWIVLTILGLIFSIIIYRKSKRGYKISSFYLFSFVFFVVLLIGFMSYKKDFSKQLSSYLGAHFPESFYDWEEQKLLFWQNPEAGYLVGKIMRVESKSLSFKDVTGKYWKLENTNSLSFLSPRVEIKPFTFIKVIGRKLSENVFHAEEIRPWRGRKFDKKRCKNKIGTEKDECIRNQKK
jgi:hypothetical protein